MTISSANNMAPLMFGGMILFMLIGYPAAFSLAATGLFFGFIGIELGLIRPDFLGNLTYQLFGIISNDLLLAIPFFTFMGAILERCGLAEDLLNSIGQLFGRVRGGMSYAVIFVGAILGAITGTVAASVIAMGVISMTPMIKNGYSVRHTMGVIAASGTITQLIPPSLVLDRSCRCARPLGRRHVCRIDRAEHDPDRTVLHVRCRAQHRPAAGRAGVAVGSAHAPGLAALEEMPARNHSFAWPDLPRARHDFHGSWRRRPKPARWAWSARSRSPGCMAR